MKKIIVMGMIALMTLGTLTGCVTKANAEAVSYTHLNTCPHCKTVWACSDINVTLYEGEILGIVGESGSGKSTLMKSLYFDFDITEGQGYLRDFENGEADIFGQSLQKKKYIKNHIMGMVYQNPLLGLRMDYSGAGNIAEKLIAAGQRNFAGMNERVEELLDAVEILQSRKKEPPKNFSGGMQQRVQISKALANNPAILLLDEVTTGLDLSVQMCIRDRSHGMCLNGGDRGS